ncbi:MAG: hypothetical protein E7401_00455 [Ruminococcaceae bacterium]|nr:hypothetical protein [Oscillospiraceae bacterium]
MNNFIILLKDFLFYRHDDRARNFQEGSREMHKGLDLLNEKAGRLKNYDYKQKKGWLFEYTEAIKFNTKAGNKGKRSRAEITDAIGKPHDPSDINIVKDGKVIQQIQAKVYDKASDTAFQFRDKKYHGMQRLTTKDKAKRVKEITKARMESDSIYADDYKDSYHNITESGIECDGIKSGGTKESELKLIDSNPNKFNRGIILKQKTREVGESVLYSMLYEAVENVPSDVCKLLNREETFSDAMANSCKYIGKGLMRGGINESLKIVGEKANISKFTDASVNVPITDYIMRISPDIYSFIKGNISEEELAKNLLNSTKDTVVSICLYSVGVPMYIYSISASGISAYREILRTNNLEEEEYKRATALYIQLLNEAIKQREIIERDLNLVISRKKDYFLKFINEFENSMCSEKDLDKATEALVTFSQNYGIEITYTDYKDFKKDFLSKKKMTIG